MSGFLKSPDIDPTFPPGNPTNALFGQWLLKILTILKTPPG
jgi:hypothetical protein